jgi:hypothetical protein
MSRVEVDEVRFIPLVRASIYLRHPYLRLRGKWKLDESCIARNFKLNQFNFGFRLLDLKCRIRPISIPQFDDASSYVVTLVRRGDATSKSKNKGLEIDHPVCAALVASRHFLLAQPLLTRRGICPTPLPLSIVTRRCNRRFPEAKSAP